MKQSDYTTPTVKTMNAREIVSALGPASAGSGTSAPAKDDFTPNTDSCGFTMGYTCP